MSVILVPLSLLGWGNVPLMVWLWGLKGHDSQQTQPIEGVHLHVYNTENHIHIRTCSCHISPSDVRLHIVDPFSNIWHEALKPDCCGKRMKGGTEEMIQPLGACASGNLRTFKARSGLDGSPSSTSYFQQELGLGGFTVSVS